MYHGKENPLRLNENIVINSLPFDLGYGLKVRGLKRANNTMSAWVVNADGEGNWMTFDDIREWWILEKQFEEV